MGDRDLLKWGRLSNFYLLSYLYYEHLKNIYTIILIYFGILNKLKYNLIMVIYSKGGFNRDANNKNSNYFILSF